MRMRLCCVTTTPLLTWQVVGTAMGLCPSRGAIQTKFKLPDEAAAAEQMGAFLALMEPLVGAVLRLIEKNSLNFPINNKWG